MIERSDRPGKIVAARLFTREGRGRPGFLSGLMGNVRVLVVADNDPTDEATHLLVFCSADAGSHKPPDPD